MLTGIDLSETVDVVSAKDKGEPMTVFKVSAIGSRVQARVGRLAGADGAGSLEAMMEAFRFGVKNIVNLNTSTGTPVPFKTEIVLIDGEKFSIVAHEILDMLPLNIITEIGGRVMQLSNLSDNEIKN